MIFIHISLSSPTSIHHLTLFLSLLNKCSTLMLLSHECDRNLLIIINAIQYSLYKCVILLLSAVNVTRGRKNGVLKWMDQGEINNKIKKRHPLSLLLYICTLIGIGKLLKCKLSPREILKFFRFHLHIYSPYATTPSFINMKRVMNAAVKMFSRIRRLSFLAK